jgi:hypothetical protein
MRAMRYGLGLTQKPPVRLLLNIAGGEDLARVGSVSFSWNLQEDR